jgi:thiol-disulfide isomerase/thioredoxin
VIERAPTSACQTAGVSRRVALLLPTMSGARSGFLRMVAAVALMLPTIAISAPSVEAQAPAGFAVHESPRPLPEIRFENSRGEAMSLADFRGKVVLLNIWATWCAPCRREMPTLERLQAELGGPDFEVVALSIDRNGPPVVKKFYEELGLRELGMYIDSSGKAPRAERAGGPDHAPDRPGRQGGRPSARSSRMGQPGDGGLHPRTDSAAIRGICAPGIARAACVQRGAAAGRTSRRALSFQ